MFNLPHILTQIRPRGYINIPFSFENTENSNLFAVAVSSVSRYQHLGIREGAHLILNPDLPFEEGELSCFVDTSEQDNPQFKLDIKRLDGCEYAGQIICCVNHYN